MTHALETTIARVDPQGAGVGPTAEGELRVPAAFLGERVRADLAGRSRHRPLAHGALREVLTPHPSRRASPCPRAGTSPGQCGGCAWIELEESAQREHARAMLGALGLDVADVAPSPESWAYRRASKRVAFTRRGELWLGSWSPRTHVGASMRGCRVDHPRLTRAFEELEAEARRLGVRAYDEATGEGELRYAWARMADDVLVMTLITGGGDPRPLAAALHEPDAVAHAVQRSRGNAIRGEAPRRLVGDADLTTLGFSQPNPALIAHVIDDLLKTEADAALEGTEAWDLYAGAGAITNRLRERFEVVVPVERYPESAARLGVEPVDVEAFLEGRVDAPELVIANPPRRGLGEVACAALARLAPPRLHVMSCGPEGLARDRARLLATGYREVQLRAYHSLPQTPHVELILKLVRGSPKE